MFEAKQAGGGRGKNIDLTDEKLTRSVFDMSACAALLAATM
jgi:hypothetical protein